MANGGGSVPGHYYNRPCGQYSPIVGGNQEIQTTTPRQREAEILGVHLEGPFLNPEKRGAHPAEYLLPLTLDNVKTVLADYTDLVKIITLAPELDPRGDIIPYLRSLGITVSLGHSLATAEEAEKAFQQGATMVTHAFNAMPSLHHRQGDCWQRPLLIRPCIVV